MSKSGVRPLQLQPPGLFIGYRTDAGKHISPAPLCKSGRTFFIGYRTVDRKALLSCTYLKAVEHYLSATALMQESTSLLHLSVKAVGTVFIGYRTRMNPGRPRLHWAGNPNIIMLGMPARSSRPAPSSGCAIPLWPRKLFAIIATIMTIIAIIAIGAPFLQLVVSFFVGWRLVAGKHISPAPLCFPPSRPP